MTPLRTTEIAAVLGISAAGVRQIVRRHGIASVGKDGRAKLYWFADVKRHVGGHDRRVRRKRRSLVSQ